MFDLITRKIMLFTI